MNCRLVRYALFVCLVGILIPAAFAQDNPSVTGQLNDAKPIVATIKKEATGIRSPH